MTGMPPRSSWIGIVACLAVIVSAWSACARPAGVSAARTQDRSATSSGVDSAGLAALLDSMCVRFAVNGGSAALELPGGRTWSGACGEAWAGEPATPAHAYEAGSITKTYTAALVLGLVADRRVSLDDAVAPLLPDIPGLDGVTVRHLLQHTSGLFDFTSHPGYLNGMRADFARRWTSRELIAEFPGERVFEPGARWGYANVNYHVLGLLVEAVTAQPFHHALRERVLRPNGLTRTWLAVAEPIDAPVAHAFLDIDGDGTAEDLTALVPATSFRSSAWAAGAVVVTAPDLAHWLAALVTGDALPSAMRDAMLAGRDRGDGMQHGLGVIITRAGDRRLVGHKGNSAGFSASAWAAPEDGASVAVLTNLHATDVTPIALALLERALGT